MNQAEKDYFYSRDFALQGRVFYPEVFEPKVPKNSTTGKAKYSCLFAWDIGSQQALVNEVGQFLGTAKEKFWPQVPAANFNNPIKKWGVYQKRDGSPVQPFLENQYWMNLGANVEYKPQVVHYDGVSDKPVPVLDRAQVYSGRNAVLSFSFFGYNANGNVGISANLVAILLLEGGEKEVSVGGVDLNTAFGQFANQQASGGIVTPTQEIAQPAQNIQQEYQETAAQNTNSDNSFI